ncbi:MAG: acyl-CoA dehydrogenase, partial [Bdellovibrionota bacterium]
LTVGMAKGKNVLGSLPVWIAGSIEQKARISKLVTSGGYLAFAMTEPLNGSDLNQTLVSATRHPSGGFKLIGEKWLINNATRSECVTVLARTESGLSLFFVDKKKAKSFSHTPKIRLMGVKGLDVSGIRFDATELEASSLVGREGQGLEVSLKSLMISRILCVGFSLGPVETALRLVFEFFEKRRLYGDAVIAIPNVRSRLAGTFADFHLADLFTRASFRLPAVLPEQLSLHSAAAKLFVPELCEEGLRDVLVTLGARYFLHDDFAHGLMQKFARDLPLVGVFDGSSQVNLYSIANQIPAMAGYSAQARVLDREVLKAIFADGAKAAMPDFAKLKLSARGENAILATLLSLDTAAVGPSLAKALAALKECSRRLIATATSRPRGEATNQRLYFSLAEDLIWIHAGAFAIFDFIANAGRRESMTQVMLDRILRHLDVEPVANEDELRHHETVVFDELARRVRGEISFGLEESALPGWYGRLTSRGFSK